MVAMLSTLVLAEKVQVACWAILRNPNASEVLDCDPYTAWWSCRFGLIVEIRVVFADGCFDSVRVTVLLGSVESNRFLSGRGDENVFQPELGPSLALNKPA